MLLNSSSRVLAWLQSSTKTQLCELVTWLKMWQPYLIYTKASDQVSRGVLPEYFLTEKYRFG